MEERPMFKISFKHNYDERQNENAKENFWEPFINWSRNRRSDEYRNIEITASVLEARIRNNFSRRLKERLERMSASRYFDDNKISLARSIVFSVESINYNSLDIGLIVEPIEKLSQLFENNFSYFEVFLKNYALPAFAETVSHSGDYGFIEDYRYIIDDLRLGVSADPEFKRQFEHPYRNALAAINPATASLSQSTSQTTVDWAQQKAKWVWILSNTSLVIPVLIACVCIYWFTIRLQNRERNVDEMQKELYLRQKSLIDVLIEKNARPSSPPCITPCIVASPCCCPPRAGCATHKK